ncbi:MAG: hybrid sensor histidine kinase/response regulator [Candidatus Sulfotelmatobacter sp.]
MGPKNKDEDLLQKLLATFRVEAEEHVQAISSGLIELEKASSPEEQEQIIESIFREAHSLKGAARAVNLVKVETACQALESLFARLKAREINPSAELLDRFHQLMDALTALLSSDAGVRSGESSPLSLPDISSLPNPALAPHTLAGLSVDSADSRPSTISPPVNMSKSEHPGRQKQRLSETMRVPASKLDALLRQAEELIPVRATMAQRITELRETHLTLTSWETEWRKMRSQMNLLPVFPAGDYQSVQAGQSSNGQAVARSGIGKITACLDRNQSTLGSVKQRLATLTKHLEYDRRVLQRRVDDLVEEITQVSMLPFSALLEFFPKLVRDLSRDCGKDVDLSIAGGEIETDRRILEEMKDPLIHLVRNCVDHGIETPKRREEAGKSPRAIIRIAVSPKSADKVEIVISDDGNGIDLQKVRTASVKLGLISSEEAGKLGAKDAAELIFKSGLSTNPMITEISGRGLGLAIVREKVENIGGTVSLETQPGTGTTFRMILPLTLARFRGIVVRAGAGLFVLPTRHVKKVLRVSPGEIKSAQNRETIQIDGRAASAVRLTDVLEMPRVNLDPDPKRKVPVLVLAWAGEQIGFVVDEILDEQEVLVKSMGKQLPRVRNIAGATVLGTGKILPVLNIADLMLSAVRIAPSTAPRRPRENTSKSILVAEDSITARTLLKNILEFAGYKVKTAVDGADALQALAVQDFNLVVSDVEMPRMGGFDLTARIRADKRHAQLPVVLVTALDSRADRERGVDVGANAYIVKGSFDQGNLLEVVRRLI